MEANSMPEEQPELEAVPSPDDGSDSNLLGELRRQRADLEPFGKVKVLEVPGYEGRLGIEYQYIGSEIAEIISKKVTKETRAVHGRGMTLLASCDTLIYACRRVMIRGSVGEDWRAMKPEPVTFGKEHDFDGTLPEKLGYDADSPREVVLGLFGSEHAINQQNVMLSRWLADVTREVDEDFL